MFQYMKMIYVNLVIILCTWDTVLSGLVTSRVADGTVEDKQTSYIMNNDNFTGLYIVPGIKKGIAFLCSAQITRPRYWRNNSEVNSNSPSIWYSFEDQIPVPLIMSDPRNPKIECENETYRRNDKLMKTVFRLSLSNTNLIKLRNYTFVRFQNLKYLDLSNNDISFLSSHAFSNLSRLTTVDLSSNRLSTLDLDYFISNVLVNSGSQHLRYINLSHNSIHTFVCTATSTFLQSDLQNYSFTLDVSYNNISNIAPSCSDRIDTYYNNVTIIMNGIPINCSCSTSQNYSFRTTNSELHNCTCPQAEDKFISSLNFSYVKILCTLFLLSLPVTALVFYVCIHRKEAKPNVSLCRHTFSANVMKSINTDQWSCKSSKVYSYVYIVGSPSDSDMINMFVEELETKRNISVVFQERDEVPGYFKLDLFRKWIHSSKRTIFLLSSNFFKDSHCIHIFKLAKATEVVDGRVIVITIKQNNDVPQTEVVQFSDMLLNSICLEFIQSEEFWEHLIQIINNDRMHVHISNTCTV